jgi:hypothetical protein
MLDNQSWLSIDHYVVQNWVRIPILISLNNVLKGFGSDNFNKMKLWKSVELFLNFFNFVD